ncbi:MAG TPA: hypothetical protein PLY69_06905 [Bacteroidales bacterium]|nr:hypothetical protein [Bacteroidales bacterium]HQJ76408.1 hypothetical protein [Bacteroidota bacterium]
MRSTYYSILSSNNLVDVLKSIPQLSYTRKVKILQRLLKEFEPKEINLALFDYKEQYIKLNRVNLLRLENTLLFLAKKNRKILRG